MVYYPSMTSQTEPITRNIVVTVEIAAYLEARAKQEDRSLSATARRIFEAEMERNPLTEPEPA